MRRKSSAGNRFASTCQHGCQHCCNADEQGDTSNQCCVLAKLMIFKNWLLKLERGGLT
ncbi:hypothetical protein [Bacteroides uniformis]|uniref:hypothetical protein n=1 Tax=Bacteroides uniformis TaxID=820 RepID=UPI0024807B83|nr:hypothetical protein [Bacteroides uniformis]MDC1760484.1 hypothetical protein [Bacteroides uniformis]